MARIIIDNDKRSQAKNASGWEIFWMRQSAGLQTLALERNDMREAIRTFERLIRRRVPMPHTHSQRGLRQLHSRDSE